MTFSILYPKQTSDGTSFEDWLALPGYGVQWVIGIPSGSTANISFAVGINHSTGFTVAATTTATGSSAPATAAVVAFFYK